jgi:hypothetical protein
MILTAAADVPVRDAGPQDPAGRVHDCPNCGLTGDRDPVSTLLAALVQLTDPNDPATARLDVALARHTQILFAPGLQEALPGLNRSAVPAPPGDAPTRQPNTPRDSGPLPEAPSAGTSRPRMRPSTGTTPERLTTHQRHPGNGSRSDGIRSPRDDS